MGKTPRLPPGCGESLDEPLLHSEYQQRFMAARRLRFCLNCKTVGSMDENSRFICRKCQTRHESNLTAPRMFDRLLVLAGRGSGKTKIGAHAAREELLVPNSIGWVMGPTYKILHDSTFPTLIRLIPPSWVKRWDPENVELTLTNGAMVAFRSLEDPDRARGPHGVGWGWFDESAQSPERAYDVFEPTLIKAGGIAICTTTPIGYDWSYEKIEQRAMVYNDPGYWFCKYHSEENPLFRANPVMMRQIERAKKTMSPEFYAQEYQAERRNAQGLVYDVARIEKQCLLEDKAVQRLIPEWPNISPAREILVGMDSGADHPFGAVKIVITEGGLVVVREYLERQKAISQHQPALFTGLGLANATKITWAANKNEANLRLEFGLKGIGVVKAESKHEVGIQRVQSWLYTQKLYFAYTVPKTIEQMRAYRYADNLKPSGEKKTVEAVFKLKDELPDALRYALMAYPELPDPIVPLLSDREVARWGAFDEQTRADVETVRAYHEREKQRDLDEKDDNYPVGDFFGHQQQEW